MSKLVPSAVLVLLFVVSVSAQIQKSTHNRIFVDEDYEYTEGLRRTRGINDQIRQGMRLFKAGDLDLALEALAKAYALEPDSLESMNALCLAYAQMKQSELALSFCGRAHALKESMLVAFENGHSGPVVEVRKEVLATD